MHSTKEDVQMYLATIYLHMISFNMLPHKSNNNESWTQHKWIRIAYTLVSTKSSADAGRRAYCSNQWQHCYHHQCQKKIRHRQQEAGKLLHYREVGNNVEESSKLSSEVATVSSTPGQLVPEAEHLPGRLIMSSVIVLHASILTELPTMRVLYGHRGVVLFDPHAHTHILHLEQLQ